MTASRPYQGHDLFQLRGTLYQHCRSCGGSGFLDRPNSITSDCPQAQTETLHLNNIFQNRLDYIRGKWVSKNATA